MRNKIIIETVDELFKLFDPVRSQNDKFPYIGNDNVFLKIRLEHATFRISLGGDDAYKYEFDLDMADMEKLVVMYAFKECNIPVVIE